MDGGDETYLGFATGVGVTPVENEDWYLLLRNGSDTVIVGDVSVANVTLYLIYNQTSNFAPDPFSGILGLGSVPSGVFAGLEAQGLPSLFGFYLTPQSAGNAELTLGGIDSSKFTGAPFTVCAP